MQRKLFSYLLFFIFIFSFIRKTFSSKESKINTKRMHLANNLQKQNTQDEPDSFVSLTTENLHDSNIKNRVSFNLLKTKDEKHFYFHSDFLETQEEKISFDFLETKEEKISTIPSNFILYTLLETSNVIRLIFPYLSLFELEFNFKCTSKTFYHLYEKFLQEEKTFLQPCLKNDNVFLENRNYTRQYFDFFEKRFWDDPEHIEYTNVDSFCENLTLLPKSIRQIISFKFCKYVLFKNGHLSILKQNIEGKFVFTSFEKDPELNMFSPLFCGLQPHPLDSLQENCRFLDVHALHGGKLYIHIFKNNNFNQSIWHVQNPAKFFSNRPVRAYPKILLKNFSGFLEHFGTGVNLWKFEKQKNGIYKRCFIFNFKRNVKIKEITSKDFEHYAQDVQYIIKTDED